MITLNVELFDQLIYMLTCDPAHHLEAVFPQLWIAFPHQPHGLPNALPMWVVNYHSATPRRRAGAADTRTLAATYPHRGRFVDALDRQMLVMSWGTLARARMALLVAPAW